MSLSRVSSFPPDCLNPTSVWIVFLFQTKDRGGITISLPFTLFLSNGSSLEMKFKKKKIDCVKGTAVEFRAQHQRGLFLQVSGAGFVAEDNKVSSGLLSEMLTSS